MSHTRTAFGAPLLMASAMLLLGLAGWRLAAPVPAVSADLAPAAERPVVAAAPALFAPPAALPVIAPLPPIESVAASMSIPTLRPSAPPRPAASHPAPRRPVAVVPAKAAVPKAGEPAGTRVAEAGSRA